uniref:Uncharacterized protein n=1 Tax=Utricularia reniformis TaxID=192314 RepID=A0A1Y0B0F8_9LAMI|nr:hypothetical protein AEK19_MT0609 [Utricularia reniformis]ART30864.1 hypothetical protein AEK19_MT0609 [Utricularia reniformis]
MDQLILFLDLVRKIDKKINISRFLEGYSRFNIFNYNIEFDVSNCLFIFFECFLSYIISSTISVISYFALT